MTDLKAHIVAMFSIHGHLQSESWLSNDNLFQFD